MLKVFKIITVIGLVLVAFYTRYVNLSWGLPYPMHPDERNMAMAIQNLRCDLIPVQPEVRRPVDLHEADAIPDTALKDTEGKAELVQPRRPGAAAWSFISNCMNPHFFAYGQISLYGAFMLVLFMRMFTQVQGAVTFVEAVTALRLFSAAASMLTILIGYLAVKTVATHEKKMWNFFIAVCTALLFIFSPAFIQFAHFGTTESFLMLAYVLLLFISVKFMYNSLPKDTYVFLSALTIGLAAAAKISSLVFMIVPFILIFRYIKKPFEWMFFILSGIFYTVIITVMFSPHNLISFPEFIGALRYESDVALGAVDVFYTRAFKDTIPVLYQLVTVFPQALGWPVYGVFVAAFLAIPWKKRVYNVIRFVFLAYFLLSSFAYTKWTRFMAPALPVMIVMAGAGVVYAYDRLLALSKKVMMIPSSEARSAKEHQPLADLNLASAHHTYAANPAVVRIFHLLFFIIVLSVLIPGSAYLSIYEREDVRSAASRWIIRNIPAETPILSETANVVDIPVDPVTPSRIPHVAPDMIAKRTTPRGVSYDVTSYNFYELDNPGETEALQTLLREKLDTAQYIFVPSRRLYYNNTCWRDSLDGFVRKENPICLKREQEYPLLSDYYDWLFGGDLGFTEVASFSSFPTFSIFGQKIAEFPDEHAEETWTVFDHPVIRIFKRS